MSNTLEHSWTEEDREVWDSFTEDMVFYIVGQREEKKERIWRGRSQLLHAYILLCPLSLLAIFHFILSYQAI